MTNKHKGFILTPGGGGGVYKPRVWVHFSHQRTVVGEFLSKCSMWAGADAEHGDWIAYECRQENLDKATAQLVAWGFELVGNDHLGD